MMDQRISSKNHTQILLMAIFLGFLGIHRFVAGKTGTGVLWLLTAGVFGVGWFVDVVHLLGNCFEDYSGAPIVSEKGKMRIEKDGFGAQQNAVPEVFCWVFIGVAVLILIDHFLLLFYYLFPNISFFANFNLSNFQSTHWFLAFVWFVAPVIYPCILAWVISEKGLN